MSGDNVVLARNTEDAPVSDLYSQTVAFSHYNNLSAQLPIDPATGELVPGGITEQAVQCFENIETIIDSIDHVMNDVIRITIFVKDIQDMDAVDEVQKVFFPTYVPTRTVVAVDALPMDALIQVEALISNGEGTIPNAPQAGDILKYTNNTHNAPLDVMSTQSVAFSHYNNISAQLPIDPKSNQIVVGGVREQTAQCLKNIKAVLESIDVPFDDIVKVNVFLKDLADTDAMNEAYTRFFPDSGIARAVAYMPARTVVEVAGLPMHALVQIEAVVSHGDGTPPQLVEDRHGLILEANNTDAAPKCKLSTQTVAFSHYNNISAQLGIDPATGAMVAGGVKEQAEQCFKNIKAIIECVDHVMEDAVKVNIFLKNIDDLDAVNEVYATFFPGGTPARRVVGASALPMDALVQIDAIFGNAEGTPPVA
ncbi:MAG: Putative aminoacrylate peracid reductase RutC [Paraeggerthella hongkongensis]|uniref:Reactive intermediate/imine deaminase n=1 Tax=Paraeggerthella hongkongensis TaxID=230658 RepID=A0A369LLP4_9ACTN|nr:MULTISPECIES: RidA family protein [Paraeggerthella]MBU5404421.1 reactive intermediate/imine deaminase [Paraeggerthella hongkongensis]MCD2432117.1 reactive intermediate/imine deaminase [Paraeggerthella hominis]RDB59609.1 reactive intermediate/imine deaminase [Paraeggerthella hongkongensis]RNL48329.1 reactive intermediate/imine deaminase [Paraeggerthella hongkongensis]